MTTELTAQSKTQHLIDSLTSHRLNTLTELCRIERLAAHRCATHPSEAPALRAPMTAAWARYVGSRQLLAELRGLSPSYPFSSDAADDAQARVLADPDSNRSWNLAWLCLAKLRDDAEGMLPAWAAVEARKPEMWGGHAPSEDDVDRLAAYFEQSWTAAVDTLLRHWTSAPTWY